MGVGYYNQGLNKIFSGRFLAVYLHISILLYIRTFHSRGKVSSFKTQDLVAFSKLNPKARKLSALKFIRKKMKKLYGPLSLEGCQMKPGAARAFNFFLNDGKGHTVKVNENWQSLFMIRLHYTW